jgi:peptidoglycan/xylan/chitin deacetylase (PgdA/CDA1 family)
MHIHSVKVNAKAVCFVLLFFIAILTPLFLMGQVSKKSETILDENSIELPILMYHGLTQNKKYMNKYVIMADLFEKDLKYIKEHGYNSIVMKDLIDYVFSDKALPQNPIMITFDDGYYNNYLYGFPLIKKYQTKIVLSPIGKQIDLFSDEPNENPNYAHCTWKQLEEMKESGLVELQNHSYNLHDCKGRRTGAQKLKSESKEKYYTVFRNDFNLVQQKMLKYFNYFPTTYVFPFGAGVNDLSRSILKEAGFKAILTCEEKVNIIKKDPERLYNLCRILRPQKTSPESFFEKKVVRAKRL